MAARIDPFVDVLLREQGDQLYLLPEEPVTMVKDGKPRKVSRQPLTDQHIYALLVEVAPSESADHIDQMTETEFEYIADRGMVRVRIVPEMGRLTAVVSPKERTAPTEPVAAARGPRPRPRPYRQPPGRRRSLQVQGAAGAGGRRPGGCPERRGARRAQRAPSGLRRRAIPGGRAHPGRPAARAGAVEVV